MSDRESHGRDPDAAERFRGLTLRLRGRTGLTQRQLATRVGVHTNTIQGWESGAKYPDAGHVTALITVYQQAGVFTPGQEAAEAEALWDAVRRGARRRRPPFEPDWFARLLAEGGAPAAPDARLDEHVASPPPRQDWGEAPDTARFRGRAHELSVLRRWLLGGRCRVAAIFGIGGVGKTALAARVARDVMRHFDSLYWRSLRDAPMLAEWLAGAITFLSTPQALPDGETARLELLLTLLRERRCLLVLDNLETVLQSGDPTGGYRAGYEGFGTLTRALAESQHRSCLVVTSREAPPELGALESEQATVRSLELGGLRVHEARAMLAEKGLTGSAPAWAALVERSAGNALALRLLGESIRQVFGGDIAAFLDFAPSPSHAVFGGIRRLLDEQLGRLSGLEQEILQWMAVAREPLGIAELAADLGPTIARGTLLEAVDALRRRSLLERGTAGRSFSLHSVVLEQVTHRVIDDVCEEIAASRPDRLVRHLLVRATTRDHVRRTQEQLIAAPILAGLSRTLGSSAAVERRLTDMLGLFRARPLPEQGYGPGNVVNLLRLLRGDLRGAKLAGLAIRQAYLQDVDLRDASLAGAHLTESVLASAFDTPVRVALSADARYLAACISDGQVHLWRVSDRAPLLSLVAHAGAAMSLALGVDRSLIVSGGVDGAVRLWRASDGVLLATMAEHAGAISTVALSADERLIASGGMDGTIRLWESPTGRSLVTLSGHPGGVTGVALSRDGRLIASAGADGAVRLWAGPAGRLTATLPGHAGGVWAVAVSGDGRLIASAGADGAVRLWAGPAGRLIATLPGHAGGVWAVAVSADGRLVASGTIDGAIKLWETPGGRLLGILPGHSSHVQGLALSGDGRLVASAGADGAVRLWAAPSGRLLSTIRGRGSDLRAVALSADGRLAASGGGDGLVRLWDTSDGRLVASLEGDGDTVRAVALSGDGRLVASGGTDGAVRLWEASSGRVLDALWGHRGGVLAVALSADGRFVASGGVDGAVRLWEASSGRLAAYLSGHLSGIWSVALSGDGRLLASAGLDGTVRLWRGPDGHLLVSLSGHAGGAFAVAASADGRLVASGGSDGTVRLWEAASGRLVATLRAHAGSVRAVAVSADGRLIASGGVDGAIKLWDGAGGRLLETLRGHTNAVWALALSADGRLLASGGLDGTLRTWATGTGAPLRSLRVERRCERLDITSLDGVTDVQRAGLIALGAVDHAERPVVTDTATTIGRATHAPS